MNKKTKIILIGSSIAAIAGISIYFIVKIVKKNKYEANRQKSIVAGKEIIEKAPNKTAKILGVSQYYNDSKIQLAENIIGLKSGDIVKIETPVYKMQGKVLSTGRKDEWILPDMTFKGDSSGTLTIIS